MIVEDYKLTWNEYQKPSVKINPAHLQVRGHNKDISIPVDKFMGVTDETLYTLNTGSSEKELGSTTSDEWKKLQKIRNMTQISSRINLRPDFVALEDYA